MTKRGWHKIARDTNYLGLWRRNGVDIRRDEGCRTRRKVPERTILILLQGLDHHQIHVRALAVYIEGTLKLKLHRYKYGFMSSLSIASQTELYSNQQAQQNHLHFSIFLTLRAQNSQHAFSPQHHQRDRPRHRCHHASCPTRHHHCHHLQGSGSDRQLHVSKHHHAESVL